MEIIGSMDVPIVIGKRKLVQNLKVINALTNRNIILGRDFLGKFDNVEFDFPQNKVLLGNNWSTCYTIESPEKVRLHHNVSIPGRSKGIVLVKCKKSSSLITADFEPVAIGGASGVYATRCHIIPDLDGIFNITLLNVNEHPISLGSRKHIGNLIPSDETIPQQDFAVITEQFARDVRCGESLLPNEKERLFSLLDTYKDIFAANPKKPSHVTTMQHRIITDNAQPVKQKPRRIPQAWTSEVNEQIQEMLQSLPKVVGTPIQF